MAVYLGVPSGAHDFSLFEVAVWGFKLLMLHGTIPRTRGSCSRPQAAIRCNENLTYQHYYRMKLSVWSGQLPIVDDTP